MMSALEVFLSQNDTLAATLRPDQLDSIEEFAEHHAGGLFVLLAPAGEKCWMKCHEDWGDDGRCVVHIYDADDESVNDIVMWFEDGLSAVDAFLALMSVREVRSRW